MALGVTQIQLTYISAIHSLVLRLSSSQYISNLQHGLYLYIVVSTRKSGVLYMLPSSR